MPSLIPLDPAITYALHCLVCMTLLITGCLLIIDGLPEKEPKR